MKKFLLNLFLSVSIITLVNIAANAQSRLIHYWHFNALNYNDTIAAVPGTTGCLTTPVVNNRLRAIAPDYSVYSSEAVFPATPNTAAFAYTKQPGVSANYPSVAVETVCFTYLDFTTGTTVNSLLGAVAGNCARPRNPTDSMQVLIYAPTTGYQNVVVSWASENSSTTSGPRYELFDYSLDSGVTWTKTGLSKVKDSTWSVFNTTSVNIFNPAAYNNPRLVFRIKDSVNSALGSGNIRYDNVAVQGDTLLPSGPTNTGSTLIYFWDFNTFSGTFTNPNFPYLAPDYFIHDSSKAKVHMGLYPGTSLANPTYFDEVSTSTYSGTDGDTVNDTWPLVPALNPRSVVTPTGSGTVNAGIRCRNPQDSDYLYFYMPTLNYKNIVLKFCTESSSLTSGDSIQLYWYSVDSGLTWRNSGISELYDSAWIAGMPTGTFGYRPSPIQITFTDPAANNCSKLVFRMHLVPRFSTIGGTSGNNRFDNISVQGDSIIQPLGTILTTATAFGPLCNSANSTIYVPFTSSGNVVGPFHVQITNSLGVFPTNFTSNIIDSFSGGFSGTSGTITAIVPAGTLPGSTYRVRVISAYPGVYGSDNGSNIVLTGVAAPISGPTTVCAGGSTIALIETGAGAWSSSNPSVGTVAPTTGVVTGITSGITNITYSVGTGCNTSTTITVNPLPAAFGGTSSVCVANSTTLTDASTPGTWTSGSTTIATVGSSTGVVNGITAGTASVTYTLPTGCLLAQTITVNPNPAAIGGTNVVCRGLSTTLTDAGSGTWTSSNIAQATVGSTTGIVNGISAGVPTITYSLPTGCMATIPVTVNPVPAPITGPATGCVGVTASYSNATGFGAWSSSNTSVVTIGSGTGVASGIALGTATLSYTLSTGCQITTPVTINASPAAITGTFVFCAGNSTTLGNTVGGGTWSSSNTAVATIGSSTGTVTGIVGGTPTITYTLPSGCFVTQTITVNALPAPIAGSASLYCIGSTTTLTDATPGGVWTSASPSIATIGSATGFVTGLTPGTSTITYALTATGCGVTLVETVNPTPAAITGSSNACVGLTNAYSDVTAFGAWSSSNTSVIVIGSGTGIAVGVSTGPATITYSVASGCSITKNVTVNGLPAPISGTLQVCAGSNDTLTGAGGGNWSSSIPALANVNPLTGVVSGVAAGNPTISYTIPSTGCYVTAPFTVNPLPYPIGGATSVYCIGSTASLLDFTPGGTWASSNTAVATVGASTGIVTGIGAGSTTITYTLPTGCMTTYLENITSTPAPISGTYTTCIGSTRTLSDATAFGAWVSSNTAIATVGSGTGVVTGVTSGTATITYELSGSCLITQNVTVNPQPSTIGGTPQTCLGSTSSLTDVGGGSWTSSIPALASIDPSSGVVSGVVAGNVVITYTLPTGCYATSGFTVNPLPVISGTTSICMGGLPVSLTSSIAGGEWSSSNPSVVAIDPSLGAMTGASLGGATITYTLPTSCWSTTTVTVNPPPASISGASHVCIGNAITLTDAGGGGWYSSNPSVAAVGFGSGIVSGMSYGTATITYTLGTSCISTTTIRVDTLPVAVTGGMVVCQGNNVTLIDATATGTWTSSTPLIATVGSSSGMVTGVSGGVATIVYSVTGTGCLASATVTVNPVSPIIGAGPVCVGSTLDVLDGIPGGSWTSSATSVATVDPSGSVSGIASGTAVITYTLPTSCWMTALITVNPLPSAVTGNFNVCLGATNTLVDTTSGGSWSVGTPTVASVGASSGMVTGFALGTSEVYYSLPTGCLYTAVVTVDPLPTAITGMGAVCAGATDTLSDTLAGGSWTSATTSVATIGVSNGVLSAIMAGADMITYTLPTGCKTTRSFVVNALPAMHVVTGGGNYCAGGSGLHIGLSGSDTLVNYQLYKGTATVGTAHAGTDSLIDFGLQTAAGSYTVKATSTVTGCSDIMTGSETITILPLPNRYNVTGGGGFCLGGAGVHVGLSGSDSMVAYQLYRIPTATGAPMSGTGSALDFGPQTTPGAYDVMANNTLTTCTNMMNDTVLVAIDTLFSPSDTVKIISPTGTINSGDTVKLGVTTSGSGGYIRYQWIINSTYIAGATSNTFTYSGFNNGDSVSCVVVDSTFCGFTLTYGSKTLRIHTVGVAEVSMNGANLSLVPNPNKGSFALNGSIGSLTANEAVTLEVTNMLGQVVYTANATTENGLLNQQVQITSGLSSGNYLLNVRSETAAQVFHFVIEK